MLNEYDKLRTPSTPINIHPQLFGIDTHWSASGCISIVIITI